MKRAIVLLGIALSVILVFSDASALMKRQIAVFSFVDKSGKGTRWWDGKSPGDGMADMLITTLVKSGKFSVIERDKIQNILSEQKLGMSGLMDERNASQVGKLLGVELAVIGSITEFGVSSSETGAKIQWLDVGVKTQKATVAVDVRLVNTTTGEIIAAETVRKVKSKSGLKLGGKGYELSDQSGFDKSLIGKATREAVDEIAAVLARQIQDIPIEGKVIKISGETVYIKPGANAGVSIGDTFVIYSVGEALIDPDTGLSLGSEEEIAGSIQINQLVANGKAAKGIILTGSNMKVGNIVRPN